MRVGVWVGGRHLSEVVGWSAYLGTGPSGLNVQKTHWGEEGEAGGEGVAALGNSLRHTCDYEYII